MAAFYRSVERNLHNVEVFLQLFETEPGITDKPSAKPLSFGGSEVVFNNVTFSYDFKNTTLKELSFKISPGSRVALVGETGSGKSSCLNLLCGYFQPKYGSIMIDGQDITDCTLDSLRETISIASQSPEIFDGKTVMYNILYARKGATPEEVYEACKKARIHDVIMRLPKKYDTSISKHGILSTGECQRIGIARIFLRDPHILLYDEATSNLDMITESAILKNLDECFCNRTQIFVTHNFGLVYKFDLIIVMKEGSIYEQGNHEELLGKKGIYFNLWLQRHLA